MSEAPAMMAASDPHSLHEDQPNPLRRKPMQQRSAQRVEKMLDACAALVHEHGYDGVTTTMIAKRAGVAVGSLYQFFPDKRAVVQALTQRNLERFVTTVDERLHEEGTGSWRRVVDIVIDVYLEMHRSVPGFSRLHFGDVVDLRLLHDKMDNNAVLADKLGALLEEPLQLTRGAYELPIAIAVEAADGVLKLAFRRDPLGDQRIVDEAKALIKDYLAERLDIP